MGHSCWRAYGPGLKYPLELKITNIKFRSYSWGVTFLPVSNLPFTIGTIMGERLLYLPSLGFCFLLGTGYRALDRRVSSQWVVPAAAAFLLGLYGVRT